MRLLYLLAVGLVLFLAGCGGDDERARIVEAIERSRAAVEAGRLDDFARQLSQDYHDDEGRDRQAVLAMVGIRLRSGGDTHVWYRLGSIEVDGPRARVSMWVAIGSRPIDLPWARGVRAETGQLQLEWAREGRSWRVTSARWQGVSLDELRGADG